MRHALPLLLCATLAGCAGTQPHPYADLPASRELRLNTQDPSGRIPYRYSAYVDWKTYRNVILDPVVIYQGDDHQFNAINANERLILARYMDQQFADTLQGRFKPVQRPAPRTLRIRLTLTGAERTTPYLGTFSRFDLAGGPYNLVQTLRGNKGSFTGSVSYSVEVYNAYTNRLLDSYVTKQYPSPLDIGATHGDLTAAKAGIDKGAQMMLAQFK